MVPVAQKVLLVFGAVATLSIEPRLFGRHQRRPFLADEQSGEPTLDREHRTQHAPIPPVPAHPGAKNVFPHQYSAAIEPRHVQFVAVVAVPTPNLMLHVPPLKPLVP